MPTDFNWILYSKRIGELQYTDDIPDRAKFKRKQNELARFF